MRYQKSIWCEKIDCDIAGGGDIGPDREGGDFSDKEVAERPRRLEDHARGRQPQPQDQRHYPRASHGSNQVEEKIGNGEVFSPS